MKVLKSFSQKDVENIATVTAQRRADTIGLDTMTLQLIIDAGEKIRSRIEHVPTR